MRTAYVVTVSGAGGFSANDLKHIGRHEQRHALKLSDVDHTYWTSGVY
jgi:hypothetical protein